MIDRFACPVAASEGTMERSYPMKFSLSPVMTVRVRTLIVETLPTVAGQFRLMWKRTSKYRGHNVMSDTTVRCRWKDENGRMSDRSLSSWTRMD